MNLVFIYGSPAAGKLTVAQELAKRTGYRLFKNHTFVACIAEVFPFESKDLDDVRSNLSRKLRIEIFEEAAREGVNLITTFGMSGSRYFGFFDELKHVIENKGGKVLFVQLTASKEELLRRVESDSRKGNKIDSKEMLNDMLNKKPELFEKYPGVEHQTIDNTNLSPEEVVKEIRDYYEL